MVSFRFHIVSLTAVFLAIALGVAVGVTVVDKNVVGVKEAQVRKLQSQLNDAKNQKKAVDQNLSAWDRFSHDIDDSLLSGRLSGQNVVVVSEAGLSSDALNQVSSALHTAGVREIGSIQFTNKWYNAEAVADLASITGETSSDPTTVRQSTMNKLVSRFADGTKPQTLSQLVSHGYVEWKAVDDTSITPDTLALGNGVQALVIGSSISSIPAEDAIIPFAKAMAATYAQRFVLATTSDDENAASARPALPTLISMVRKDGSFDGKLTTVDNVETLPGRTALVLAMADLTVGRVGDYGSDSTASRAVPGEDK